MWGKGDKNSSSCYVPFPAGSYFQKGNSRCLGLFKYSSLCAIQQLCDFFHLHCWCIICALSKKVPGMCSYVSLTLPTKREREKKKKLIRNKTGSWYTRLSSLWSPLLIGLTLYSPEQVSVVSRGGESELRLASVSHGASGNYTCLPANAKPSSVILHVIIGEWFHPPNYDRKCVLTISYIMKS